MSGDTMAGRIVKGMLTSSLGYVFVVGSAFTISAAIRVMTGHYPSLCLFTLELITFKLIEINQAFLIVPLLTAMFTTIVLSCILIDTRIAGGLSLASYYIVVGIFFTIIGTGDFPYDVLTIWVALTFLLGFLSAMVADTLVGLPGFR